MNSKIIQLRKELHQHPELSGEESKTAQRIQQFIQAHYPTKIIDQLGGNGLAAIYEFASTGPTIAIRCELDALPIEEENQFEYRSKTKGVSHKCGHDGHMAIVSGIIFWLQQQNLKNGKVILLFQPAEETGKGAYQVLQDPRFKALNIDYFFSLHNIPKEPMHKIMIMEKGFSAEVQSFSISIKGKESHAAEPENGINPAEAIAELIKNISALNHPDPSNESFQVLTPVHITMGQKSYGISPANGELHYTIRTWSTKKMTALKQTLETIFERVCKKHSLTYQADWFEYFPASKNDEECNALIKASAKLNHFKYVERPHPFKFGEDFGWFSKHYKTGMFGLGSGMNTPALHNANYDFPNEIIETGVMIFGGIIKQILQ